MTIESSRRRATWRVGSVLAAAAGSVLVATAVVARRRGRPPSRPAVAPRPALDASPPRPVVVPPPDTTPVPGVDVEVEDRVRVDPVPPQPPRPPEARRRWPLVATAVVAVVVVALVTAFAGQGGGDGPDTTPTSQDAAATTPEPSTTTVEDLTPTAAFAQASRRLEAAGSFAYSGTSLATDVSPVRPGVWLAVELSVAGEVDLASNRLHEIGTASSGRVTETVTDGLQVWGRLADGPDDLADVGLLTVGERRATSRRFGAGLLPSWLASSVDRAELTSDEPGRHSFRATIPAEALGVIEDGRPPVSAELVLTLDDAGDPVHVEITSAPEGPRLRLAFELSRLGDSLPITVPTGTAD